MSQADSISFNRVTIVGPGLLGASIGMALKEKKLAKEVWAHLRDEEKKRAAKVQFGVTEHLLICKNQ